MSQPGSLAFVDSCGWSERNCGAVQAQEAGAKHPQITIELLNTAHEMFRAAPAAAGRQIYHIGSLLAREHLALGEVATAQRLLQSVAGLLACCNALYDACTARVSHNLCRMPAF